MVLKRQRESNFELLRIISMFMILMVHANFYLVGPVTPDEFSNEFIASFTRISFEMLSIGAVNVFVMISGWFGIKPSINGLGNFVFQCLYFILGLYTVALIHGVADFSPRILFDNIFKNCGWFIKAYIGLYLLAPMINLYIEKSTKKQIRNFLILFFSFEFIYGWIVNTAFISQGYGTFSFIGLYILAKYLRMQFGDSKKKIYGIYIFGVCTAINIILYICFLKLFNGIVIDLCSYINPITIAGCGGIMIFVSGMRMRTNRAINFIAKSCFAVFLLHGNVYVMAHVYNPVIRWCYDNFNGLTCLAYITMILVMFFIAAIVLNQPRKYLWNKICNATNKGLIVVGGG